MKHLLNILATWRLVELIQTEDAPFSVLETFRKQVHYDSLYSEDKRLKTVSSEIDKAIQCPYCLSVWCGLFVAICTKENPIFCFAYSAGAMLLKTVYDTLEI